MGVIRGTQSRGRDLQWACVEGVGDTMLVLHVDGKCLEPVLKTNVSSKQQRAKCGLKESRLRWDTKDTEKLNRALGRWLELQ